MALIDSGATYSFVRREWARRHGLKIQSCTPKVMRLFDHFTHQASEIAVVNFSLGVVDFRWTFMVAEAYYDVVIGIDLMKAMLLHLDPRNLMLFLPKNPTKYMGDLSEIAHSTDYIMASCIQGPVDYPVTPTRVKGICRSLPWKNLWYCALFAAQDVELVGVTASGDHEKKKLAELLDSIQPDLRKIFDSVPYVLAPPDRDPSERLVKHHIFVSTSCVPAARSAYPMGDTKLEAMRVQMKELVEKG